MGHAGLDRERMVDSGAQVESSGSGGCVGGQKRSNALVEYLEVDSGIGHWVGLGVRSSTQLEKIEAAKKRDTGLHPNGCCICFDDIESCCSELSNIVLRLSIAARGQ